MNIVIFGGAGFIGSHLYEYYVNKYPDARFSLLGREEIKREYHVNDELCGANPDVIINCAAEIYNPDAMWFSNVVVTQAILNWLKYDTNKSTKFIQVGSSLEYGHSYNSISEFDPARPVDLYSGTKAAATMLCQGYAKEYNLKIMIARPFSVYGPYEKSHRLFPTLYRAFYKNEPMILYKGNHDFIYVDDFIDGIDILVNSLDKEKDIYGSIVNFGTGESISNFELLEIWKDITGISNPPIEIKKESFMKKFETQRQWTNDTLVSDVLYGFRPKYNIVSGVSKFINRMKNGRD